MDRDAFRVVVKAAITHDGRVLVGQKEAIDDHPIAGEWHVLGGHLDAGEAVVAAVRREVREETGLEVTVEELVDATTFTWGDGDARDSLQLLYHCTASTDDAVARDDLQAVAWVDPADLPDRLHEEEARRLTSRPEQAAFLESLTSD